MERPVEHAGAERPILRAPPFPGIGRGIADVGRPGPPVRFDARHAHAVAAAVAAGRVGGDFWLPHRDFVSNAQAGEDVAERSAGRRNPWHILDRTSEFRGDPASELAVLALCAGIPVVRAGVAIGEEDRLRIIHDRLIDRRRWRNPFTAAETDIFGALEILTFWRGWVERNRDYAVASGIAWWKRREIVRFLWDGGSPIPCLDPDRALRQAGPRCGRIVIWPSKVPIDFPAQAGKRAIPITRIEDGFLRSRGLGSDLTPPKSVIIDDVGIYYDPRQPSALEDLLAETVFDRDLLRRASAMISDIVKRAIGKYGLPQGDARHDMPAGRRVVLVAGQVEDDLSVLAAGAGIVGNLGLLKRARAAEEGAWLIYRPHPDVEAGHRKGLVADSEIRLWADDISRGGSLADLLERVDAVHVLSSLTGFEALLRGREVIVHGQPFYAGWGLTTDLADAIPRRSRRLSIEELVAGALILYPRYLHPPTGLPCTPEAFLDGMAHEEEPGLTVRLRRLQGRLRHVWRRSMTGS